MIPLPRWALPYLTDKKCPVCDRETNPRYVEAIGIKEKKSYTRLPKKGEVILFFEYHCPHCDKRTFLVADPDDENFSPKDMMQNILDTFSEKSGYAKNKVSKSKITNKEVERFIKDLDSCESHEEFLRIIGTDDKSINRINESKRKDDGR